MSSAMLVTIEGLAALTDLDNIDEQMAANGSRAVNATIRRAKTDATDRINKQIKFPASYLRGQNSRLNISKFATPGDPVAKLSARSRATSLARFVKGSVSFKGNASKRGLTVEVKPGAAVYLKTAFLIKLRSGTGDSGTQNLGLAIRLKPGERPKGSRIGAKLLGKDLWLLYGPSVAQALVNAQGGGVAQDLSPDLLEYLQTELERLQKVEFK